MFDCFVCWFGSFVRSLWNGNQLLLLFVDNVEKIHWNFSVFVVFVAHFDGVNQVYDFQLKSHSWRWIIHLQKSQHSYSSMQKMERLRNVGSAFCSSLRKWKRHTEIDLRRQSLKWRARRKFVSKPVWSWQNVSSANDFFFTSTCNIGDSLQLTLIEWH